MRVLKMFLGVVLLFIALPVALLEMLVVNSSMGQSMSDPSESYTLLGVPLVGAAASIVLLTNIRGVYFLVMGLILSLLLVPCVPWVISHPWNSPEPDEALWWFYAIPCVYAIAWLGIGASEIVLGRKTARR